MRFPVNAVIDTNVLVSALITRNPDSPTVKVLEFLAAGLITPVYSTEILDEYYEVLMRPRFHLPPHLVDEIIADIKEHGVEVKEPVAIVEEAFDPDDTVFYAVSLSRPKSYTYLITGNIKHYPQRDHVVLPSEFIERSGFLTGE